MLSLLIRATLPVEAKVAIAYLLLVGIVTIVALVARWISKVIRK